MAVNNTLNGYEKDDVNIKNAVYRVKENDGTDLYSRIHFETSSKMIYDSTHEATANRVARRDNTGSIKFANIDAGGYITATGKITGGSLQINGSSALRGATTIGEGLAANAMALTVASGKNTTLGGTLSVTGVSTFTGKTTHNGGATISNGLAASGGVNITGDASISGKTTTGTLQVNGNSTMGGSANTTTINGTAAVNKLTVVDTGIVSNLNADRVDNKHVDDTKNTVDYLWTADKIDKTKADKAIKATAGNGLTGGGTLAADFTISHANNTPSKTAAATQSNTVIKSMTFDTFGHPKSYVETDLDERYPSKTNSISAGAGLTGGGTIAGNRTISHAEVGRTNAEPVINTSGTTCKVLKSVTSNNLGHITSSETIDLDGRYANKAVTISVGTALSGGGDLSANRTISHANVGRTNSTPSLGTSTASCPVLKSVASNAQGHITAAETVDLDGRYYTKPQVDQEIESYIAGTVNEKVLLKGEDSGSANGTVLAMDGFKMRAVKNSTTNATERIEFVFV